eukprot:2560540-Amphidinium_carterae.1
MFKALSFVKAATRKSGYAHEAFCMSLKVLPGTVLCPWKAAFFAQLLNELQPTRWTKHHDNKYVSPEQPGKV